MRENFLIYLMFSVCHRHTAAMETEERCTWSSLKQSSGVRCAIIGNRDGCRHFFRSETFILGVTVAKCVSVRMKQIFYLSNPAPKCSENLYDDMSKVGFKGYVDVRLEG